MLPEISRHLREKLKVFFLTDNLILNNKVIPVIRENFQEVNSSAEEKTIAFVDGGQAEILSGGNLSLSFIRVFAQVMKSSKKLDSFKHEFYVLTTAVYRNGEIWYEGKVFGSDLIEEADLLVSSYDSSIKSGNERGPISKVAGMARRFAELKLAQKIKTDYVLLDGTLEITLKNEEKYMAGLGKNVAALAKTCSLFTTCGNNPAVLLQKLSSFQQAWSYLADNNNSFVKLHPRAKHVFRFQGNLEILPFLVNGSSDPLFLGYPYGLILADKLARVSEEERKSLKMQLLLNKENREFTEYLSTTNAHEILDNLG
ncbi:MAG: hypothetical protein AABW48_05265 [Nanoarchaeota archaeon]